MFLGELGFREFVFAICNLSWWGIHLRVFAIRLREGIRLRGRIWLQLIRLRNSSSGVNSASGGNSTSGNSSSQFVFGRNSASGGSLAPASSSAQIACGLEFVFGNSSSQFVFGGGNSASGRNAFSGSSSGWNSFSGIRLRTSSSSACGQVLPPQRLQCINECIHRPRVWRAEGLASVLRFRHNTTPCFALPCTSTLAWNARACAHAFRGQSRKCRRAGGWVLPSVREDMRQVASAPRELWVLGAVGAACAPVGAHKGVRLRAPTVSDFGFDPDHKAALGLGQVTGLWDGSLQDRLQHELAQLCIGTEVYICFSCIDVHIHFSGRLFASAALRPEGETRAAAGGDTPRRAE